MAAFYMLTYSQTIRVGKHFQTRVGLGVGKSVTTAALLLVVHPLSSQVKYPEVWAYLPPTNDRHTCNPCKERSCEIRK